ncbi:MAG: hypothetical protein ABI120_07545 [Gemmatimonadaceae bacterium]
MTGRVISMYELSGSVGRGGTNFTNDVMLIQYFLFSIYIGTVFSTPFEIESTALKPAALVPMTGRFTPDIIPWIETFQQDANRKGLGPVVADGRVDACKAGWGIKTGRTAGYKTIMALNQVLVNANRDIFERLTDPNLPVALRTVLSVATSIG